MDAEQSQRETLMREIRAVRSKISRLEQANTQRSGDELLVLGERNLLRALIDSIPHAICIKDTKGRFVFVNEAFKRDRADYDPDDLIGKTDLDFVQPEYADCFRRDEEGIIKTGQAKVNYEEFGVSKDGIAKWGLATKAPIKDRRGKVIGISVLNRVIGDRKATREALQASATKFQGVVEEAAEGILVVDIHTKHFMYANPAMCKLLGYSESELTNLGVEDIHPMNELPFALSEFEAQVRGKKNLATDIPCLCKDGSIRYAYINTVRMKVEGRTCMVGFFTDVTELKNARSALGESERRFRMIMEQSFDGINIVEYDIKAGRRRLILCNDRYAEMAGRTREELLVAENLNDFVTSYGSPETGKKNLKCVFSQKPYRGQSSWIRPDGKENLYDWVAAPTKIGDRHYIVGIDRDITEQKKAEEKLRQAKKQLEERVKRRTGDLENLNTQFREEIASRKQVQTKLLEYQGELRSLASELSLAEERMRRQIAIEIHDHIGQNLALARMKIQALSESIADEDNTALTREVNDIIGEVIENVRTLTFEISPPVLYELGFEPSVEWLLRRLRKQHNLLTSFSTDAREKPLDENVRVILFQSVRELLMNVVKHAGAKHVNVAVERQGGYIEVRVYDDGKGFDVEKLTYQHEANAGFGLFSIRERLRYMGGVLSVESACDKGTEVKITAPLDLESGAEGDGSK